MSEKSNTSAADIFLVMRDALLEEGQTQFEDITSLSSLLRALKPPDAYDVVSRAAHEIVKGCVEDVKEGIRSGAIADEESLHDYVFEAADSSLTYTRDQYIIVFGLNWTADALEEGHARSSTFTTALAGQAHTALVEAITEHGDEFDELFDARRETEEAHEEEHPGVSAQVAAFFANTDTGVAFDPVFVPRAREWFETYVEAYLEALLWADSPEAHAVEGLRVPDRDKGKTLHTLGLTPDSLPREFIARAIRDCFAFQDAARRVAPAVEFTSKVPAGPFGHDFWLSRNGHGSGFFDAYAGVYVIDGTDFKKDFQGLAQKFGEVNIFVSVGTPNDLEHLVWEYDAPKPPTFD